MELKKQRDVYEWSAFGLSLSNAAKPPENSTICRFPVTLELSGMIIGREASFHKQLKAENATRVTFQISSAQVGTIIVIAFT